MRRSMLGIIVIVALSVFGGLFLKQDVSAYWTSKDGKECFAVQYEYVNVTKNGDAKQEGYVDSDAAYNKVYKAYSTQTVCATKDKKGKVTLKLEGYPDDTDHISKGDELGLKLYVADSGKTVVTRYCTKTGKFCENGQSLVEKKYKLSDYKSFKELAKAVVKDAPKKYSKATKKSLGDSITKESLKKKAEKKEEELKASGGTGSDEGESGATLTEATGDACFNANSNSQGWLLCPTMRNLEYTASWMDNMVEDWLSVDTNLYNASSPTASVWEIMRNLANIIIVIILLVVIFSQLTGVGIDNYGIKKMLPRLIAMAILINLSLIICELAIDLSNLMGTGLRNLFGSIGQGIIEGKETADHMGNIVSTMVTALLAMVAGIGAAAPIGMTVASIGFSGGIMIIVVILIALITVVAALLVFLTMLGARMVIIIGCVAVAPVALAFYILPNTQELYKKWFAAFKAALVVFPICGAVSGIGWIIRAIVLSADEVQVWMGVIGIIAPFLPFFILPSLLRNVLGALNTVGTALSTMGQGVRSGARGLRDSAQSTERYQNALNDRREKESARRAENIQKRLNRQIDSGRTLNARQLRQKRRADDTMVAYKNSLTRDRMAGDPTNYEARVAAMEDEEHEINTKNAVALMRQNGIRTSDGETIQYNAKNIESELKKYAGRSDLNSEDERQIALLSRALVEEKGASKLGGLMRGEYKVTDENGNEVTRNTTDAFKRAVGGTLDKDSTVRAKLAEKDIAASVYAESFMKNGKHASPPKEGETVDSFDEYTKAHKEDIDKRTSSYEVGLSQGGKALERYINGLDKEQCFDIYDSGAYKVLSPEDMERFRDHAEGIGVRGKRTQTVSIENDRRSAIKDGTVFPIDHGNDQSTFD